MNRTGQFVGVALWFVCTAVGCATSEGATSEGDDATASQDPKPADCVITDPQGGEAQLRQCYVETGPEGMPENIRIPIVETTTTTEVGTFTYPLKFEMEITDEGKLRLIGPIRRPDEEDGSDDEVPAETPSIDEASGDDQPESGGDGQSQ